MNEEGIIPRKFRIQEKNNVWYLDNDASNHMIGKLSYSIELNNRIGGRVKFGDDVFVEIHGKGFILFKGE